MSEQQPSELLFYTSPDGLVKMEIRIEGDTIWMSQQMMADLFQTSVPNICIHIDNILQSSELQAEGTIKENLIVRQEGARQVQRKVKFYNLDMIISVGYRVNSVRGTQFRIWATRQLSEFMRKGFVLDADRLKNPPVKGAANLPDHFDELLEQIRDIRASERRMYLRIRDILATAADYAPNNRETNRFYSAIQNKLHFAVHGHTAAELIMLRANAQEPNMGLTSWQRSRVAAADVAVAKNYLKGEEIETFNRVTSMMLDFVEDQARQRRLVFMKDWEQAVDGLLSLMGRPVLHGTGTRSAKEAKAFAESQYKAFALRRQSADAERAEQELSRELEQQIKEISHRKEHKQ